MTIRTVLVECDVCKKVGEVSKPTEFDNPIPKGWWNLRTEVRFPDLYENHRYISLCSPVCVEGAWKAVVRAGAGLGGRTHNDYRAELAIHLTRGAE